MTDRERAIVRIMATPDLWAIDDVDRAMDAVIAEFGRRFPGAEPVSRDEVAAMIEVVATLDATGLQAVLSMD